MNLSREQWKELQRKIAKGGLQEFKNFAQSMYSSGQKDGAEHALTMGMTQIKGTLLNAIETTLHDEFGFGKKRFDQFASRFNDVVEGNKIQININSKDNTLDNKDIYTLSDADKTVYIILLCITEYMNKLSNVTGSELFTNTEILKSIKESYLSLEYLIRTSSIKIDKETLDEIYSLATKKLLYLKDVEDKNVK